MKWRGYRQSGNVTDKRGMGMGGIAGGGIGAVVIAIVAMLFGVNPGDILPPAEQQPQQQGQVATANDTLAQIAGAVLASTEDVWTGIFQQSGGQDYPEPQLVLFEGMVQSACGMGQSAMGPFYCSRDQAVYIDLSFFHDLHNRFGANGDFAQAYVVAHEVGHHIQNVTGNLSHGGGNAASVEQELQADCLAGVWGFHAREQQGFVEPGDLEEALGAASAIGDDRIQQQTQGRVVPESFTHGSSAQRIQAFRRGYQSGNPADCGL
jgi:uncharacterized protein